MYGTTGSEVGEGARSRDGCGEAVRRAYPCPIPKSGTSATGPEEQLLASWVFGAHLGNVVC